MPRATRSMPRRPAVRQRTTHRAEEALEEAVGEPPDDVALRARRSGCPGSRACARGTRRGAPARAARASGNQNASRTSWFSDESAPARAARRRRPRSAAAGSCADCPACRRGGRCSSAPRSARPTSSSVSRSAASRGCGVARVDAAARERHVPGPRVARVAGALDEEHRRALRGWFASTIATAARARLRRLRARAARGRPSAWRISSSSHAAAA